jgi:hypothetical protein
MNSSKSIQSIKSSLPGAARLAGDKYDKPNVIAQGLGRTNSFKSKSSLRDSQPLSKKVMQRMSVQFKKKKIDE